MPDIKAVIEGIVSQGKLVGSRGHAFRASSSSNASRSDKPARHDHGVDVGAARNYAHEKAAKEKAVDRTQDREQQVDKRNKEAEKRQKEVAKMASEETIDEAKRFVYDKPHAHLVKAYDKRTTEDLRGMHSRWSKDHEDKKSNPTRSEELMAVHHVLKKRGENVPDLPKHKNLGMHMYEETNTEKRMKLKNVARPGDPDPKSDKSTLAKTGSITTKIIDEGKPLMSDKNFGLPASLIAAARQIVEKKQEDSGDARKMDGGKTQVILNPETDEKINEGEPKKKHTTPKTDKHKKLAALAHPKDKITHKDVLVGRGVVAKEELSSKEKMKRGLYRKEEVEQIEEGSVELKPSEFHSVRTGKKSMEDLAKKKNSNVDKVRGEYNLHADHWSKGKAHYNKLFGVQEEVELTSEEQARIAEIAKSFPAEIDEAVKKSVPSATTSVSSPIRGANQDQSGHGTKSNVADYTISDSAKYSNRHGDLTTKKMRKEEVELEEGRGRPRKNPLPDGKETEGDDTHKHPMQQLEKISHAIEGNEPHFEHKDGSKSKVTKHLAKHIVAIHNSMRTTQEKDSFAQKVHANRESMKAEVSKHF